MVYILSQDGEPLMPTNQNGKVRHLLDDGRAKVAKKAPFTIKLTYETAWHTQPVRLDVDTDGKIIKLTATSGGRILYSSAVDLREDGEYWRTLRSSKQRYRKEKNKNRKKKDPRPATHEEYLTRKQQKLILDVKKILPVSEVFVEGVLLEDQEDKVPEPQKSDLQD